MVDFSDLGGIPVDPKQGQGIDFSDLGGTRLNDVATAREKIEPGIMGETRPIEQRLLDNSIQALSGATLPTAVSAVASIPGKIKSMMGNSGSVLLKALAKSPRDLSPEFSESNAAAGISDQLPLQRGAIARFPKQERLVPTPQPKPLVNAETLPSVPPVSYPKDPAAFINFAKARVQAFGNKLSPQELDDYKGILSDIFKTRKVVSGTPQYAAASQLGSDVEALHSAAIPGRAVLNKTYGLSKTFHPELIEPLTNLVKKFGKWAVIGALSGAGFEKGSKAVRGR